MLGSVPRMFQWLLVGVLSLAIALPANLFAQDHQDHVVSSADLRKDVQAVTVRRQKSIAALDHVFAGEQGQEVLAHLHLSDEEMQKNVATLDDAEVARLSDRAQDAQSDFSAGRIDHRGMVIALVGIAAVILIIVAVR